MPAANRAKASMLPKYITFKTAAFDAQNIGDQPTKGRVSSGKVARSTYA
jgi:hypothetical protein